MYWYIRGAAKYKDKLYDDISDLGDQISLHIVKLLLFSDSAYAGHWMHEIWAFLHRMQKLKNTKKLPKAKFIYDALSCSNDIIDSLVKEAIETEVELKPRDIAEVDILATLENYQHWLSDKLSSDGYVSQEDVKSKLTELILN